MAIEEGEFKLRIELLEEYQFKVQFCKTNLNDLLMDEPKPVGNGDYPNAGLILAAAVGNCLSASLLFCLRKSRAEVESLDAEVYTKLTRNEKGRLRIDSINVELHPIVDDPKKLNRCLDIFEDFCIVTQSVRQGVPIQVKVSQPVEASGNSKSA